MVDSRFPAFFFVGLSGLVGPLIGCFAPNAAAPDNGTSGGVEESSGSAGSATGSASSSGANGATSAEATTNGPNPSTTSVGDSEGSDETRGASESDSDSTAGSGRCGDGVRGSGEECDEGEDNGLGSDCTEACTVNTCGDGRLAADEVCDDGEDNGIGSGDCAPDCSTLVETRVIRMNILSSTDMDGNMGGANAPTVLDTGCTDSGLPGYRAMFSDGVARRASVSPNTGDGQVDWVLRPWTRYVNTLGGLVWTTSETALLGVEGGAAVALLAPIDSSGGFGVGSVVTGMSENWVAQDGNMCNENSSNSAGSFRPTADPSATINGAYLDDNAGAVNCVVELKYYCVEQ